MSTHEQDQALAQALTARARRLVGGAIPRSWHDATERAEAKRKQQAQNQTAAIGEAHGDVAKPSQPMVLDERPIASAVPFGPAQQVFAGDMPLEVTPLGSDNAIAAIDVEKPKKAPETMPGSLWPKPAQKALDALRSIPVFDRSPTQRQLLATAEDRHAAMDAEFSEEMERNRALLAKAKPSSDPQGDMLAAISQAAPVATQHYRELPAADEAQAALDLALAEQADAELTLQSAQQVADAAIGKRDEHAKLIAGCRDTIAMLQTERGKAVEREAEAFRSGAQPDGSVAQLDSSIALEQRRLAVLEADQHPLDLAVQVASTGYMRTNGASNPLFRNDVPQDSELTAAKKRVEAAKVAVAEARFNAAAVPAVKQLIGELAPLLGALDRKAEDRARRKLTWELREILDEAAVRAAVRTR